MKNKKPKKMRSSRGKAPLRMTPMVSDEVLTPSKSEASQDDRLKNSNDGIFKIES
jgi:hypothetical protein